MTNLSASISDAGPAGQGIRWGWMLALGILMSILGVVGLGMSYRLTLVAMFWLGIFAIIAGAAQILDAFHHKGWKSLIWQVIMGVVYIAAGILMVVTPVSAAFWLTFFLTISLVVTGVLRILMAFQIRGRHGSTWLAVLLSGVISIVLGMMIYRSVIPPGAEALATPEGQMAWLRSWGWVIGLFIAIELIMEGAALIAIALGVRRAEGAAAK